MDFKYCIPEKTKQPRKAVLGPDGTRRKKGRPKKVHAPRPPFELPPHVLGSAKAWDEVRTWVKHNAKAVVNTWTQEKLVREADAERIAAALYAAEDIRKDKTRHFKYGRCKFAVSTPSGEVHNAMSRDAIVVKQKKIDIMHRRQKEVKEFQEGRVAEKEKKRLSAGMVENVPELAATADIERLKTLCGNLVTEYRASTRPV